MGPFLLVNGNFVSTAGMDMPNLAFARYLAEKGEEVHLVTHRASEDLAARPNVIVHYVPKPANSYLLAAPVLNQIGRRWASKISACNGRVLVNGGNCCWGDINWVHYVHAAYRPYLSGRALRILKNECAHWTFSAYERSALRRARVIITNSERTKRDVIEKLRVSPDRVHTVYYGIDGEQFRPPNGNERVTTRRLLGWSDRKPILAFIGALGDRRKGFDTLFLAWKDLCSNCRWDADLVVIGTGAELPDWKTRAVQSGLDSRIHFLGFREDVRTILAASDGLVAPTRYEAYGQAVHEALCCGLPALVSETAGVAERYPPELKDLLLPDPGNVNDLVERLWGWRAQIEDYKAIARSLSQKIRARTWNDMSAQISKIIERTS